MHLTTHPSNCDHKSEWNDRIGIAIGPRTWFGPRYLNNVSDSGTVLNNSLSGAFGYAIALSSARNFTVESNTLFGNYTFIGSRGPNCSTEDTTPSPAAFVVDWGNTAMSTTQFDFVNITDGDGLTCILPPEGGDYWPFGGNPSTTSPSASPSASPSDGSSSGGGGLSGGAKSGIAVAVIVGVVGVAVGAWFVRKWALKRQGMKEDKGGWSRDGYVRNGGPQMGETR